MKSEDFDRLFKAVAEEREAAERKRAADEAAKLTHELFTSFVEAGFARNEAVYLVSKMLFNATREGS